MLALLAVGAVGCMPSSAETSSVPVDVGDAPIADSQEEFFGRDNPWNVPIPSDPVLDEDSDALVAALARERAGYALLYEHGLPVYESDAETPRYEIECTEDWGPCGLEEGPVPVPAGARPSPGDGAMVVIDRDSDRVFDFWLARRTAQGGWEAAWGTQTTVDGDGQGGATGAGIDLLAGLVRTYEIRAGRIDHALTFASDLSCPDVFRHPATKTDGSSTRRPCLPQGARVQLDPSIDVRRIPDITPGEIAVAEALQKYGAYLRDSGAAPMAYAFERPTDEADPYPVVAEFPWDYYGMPHIPWERLRVLRQWDGR